METFDIDSPCGRHFRYRDLIECGETWSRLAASGSPVANLPRVGATLQGIQRLCREVLDPVTEVVGRVVISYGFAGPDLTRHIKGRICPSLDQHAGSERSRRGGVICSRVGQAADFVVEGVSTAAVAEFLVSSVPFDRLYYYGADRPLHVSVGPQRNSTIVWMSRSRAGRLVPRVVGKAGFLTRLRRGEDEAT